MERGLSLVLLEPWSRGGGQGGLGDWPVAVEEGLAQISGSFFDFLFHSLSLTCMRHLGRSWQNNKQVCNI